MFIPERLSDGAGLSNGILWKRGKPHAKYREAQTWQANVMEAKARKKPTPCQSCYDSSITKLYGNWGFAADNDANLRFKNVGGGTGTLPANEGKADGEEQKRNRQKGV